MKHKTIFVLIITVILIFALARVHAETVLFDDPLTSSTIGSQQGPGAFSRSGWQTMGGKIVYVLPYPVEHGYVECYLKGDYSCGNIDKSHILSGWEYTGSYNHHNQHGSFWNVRMGSSYHPFKLLATPQGLPAREETLYNCSPGTTPHKIKVEWRDGTITFYYDGSVMQTWSFPRMKIQAITIGRDDLYGICSPAPSISYLKIVDRASAQPTPTPTPTPDPGGGIYVTVLKYYDETGHPQERRIETRQPIIAALSDQEAVIQLIHGDYKFTIPLTNFISLEQSKE